MAGMQCRPWRCGFLAIQDLTGQCDPAWTNQAELDSSNLNINGIPKFGTCKNCERKF